MFKKEYKYPKNWFKHNLIPVPTEFVGGNCSACIFRDIPQYCEKMSCTYIDSRSDSLDVASVYWVGRETHANMATWTELNDFFNTVPKQRIRDISNDIKNCAILVHRKQMVK